MRRTNEPPKLSEKSSGRASTQTATQTASQIAENQEAFYREIELARNPLTRMLNRLLLECWAKMPTPK